MDPANIPSVSILNTVYDEATGTIKTSGTTTVTLPNEGQQTMADSISVAVASDQTPVAIKGSIDSAATDSDNTVTKVGTKYNATQPTLSDAQRGEFQIDARGNQRVTLMSAGTNAALSVMADNADAVSDSVAINKMTTITRNTVWNGTTWDRAPGNSANGTDVDVTRVIPGTSATHLGKAVDSAAGATDTGVAALYIRDDALTTLTPADGDYVPGRVDSEGAMWVREKLAPAAEDNTNGVIATVRKYVVASTYAGSRSTSFGTVTKATVVAAPGVPIAVYVSNENAAVRYFQLHNKASDPAGTNVPLYSFAIPAGTANNPGILIMDQTWFENDYFSTGVGWAVSTTKATFTDSATASEHTVDVRAA